MASKDRDAILSRWRAAKKADPKLTRGEFMMKGSPGKYKNKESAAAYLRVLESGKRSGSVLWERSRQTLPGGVGDLYQVAMPDKHGRMRSFDLEVEGGRSSFDAPLIEHRLRADGRALAQKRQEWARRYDIDLADIDTDEIIVRKVKTVTKRTLHISLGDRSPVGA